jgi:hypothetical protein
VIKKMRVLSGRDYEGGVTESRIYEWPEDSAWYLPCHGSNLVRWHVAHADDGLGEQSVIVEGRFQIGPPRYRITCRDVPLT